MADVSKNSADTLHLEGRICWASLKRARLSAGGYDVISQAYLHLYVRQVLRSCNFEQQMA